MVVAIMQPYLFPYIGYFQLMSAVDCFVVYDDAQYMKGGWINRNRILSGDAPRWWTYPVVRDDFRLPIHQRRYDRSADQDRSFLGKLEGAYRRAPCYQQGMDAAAECLANSETSVSILNSAALRNVSGHLGIGCEFRFSSKIDHDRSLVGEERVIELCRQLGATQYLNAIGGLELYRPERFASAGLTLRFLRPRASPYPQWGGAHVPSLSIMDVLMFNRPEAVRAMLDEYDLVQA